MNQQLTVFIGGPFTAHVDPGTGLLSAMYRRRYEELIEFFGSRGWRTLNAHREEGWGQAIVPAAECTERDYRWMRECDLFVAFPGEPASPGTHVEFGWASALRRPTVVLLEPGVVPAALVAGLGDLAPVTYVEYTEDAAFLAALAKAVNAVVEQAGVTWRLDEAHTL